jgi:hypothetical protein
MLPAPAARPIIDGPISAISSVMSASVDITKVSPRLRS